MDTTELPDVTSIDKIEDGLFLGNLTAALDVRKLSELHISHILTVEAQPLPLEITKLKGLATLFVQANDMSHEDLLSEFPVTNSFIKDGQQKGNVLIHCYFGVSRSATIVAAYLMEKYSLTVDEAMARIKEMRKCVGPNSGFISQLLLFYTMGYTLKASHLPYKLYKLEKLAAAVKCGNFSLPNNKYGDVVYDLQRAAGQEGNAVACCRKCRLRLVTKEGMLLHLASPVSQWSLSQTDATGSACRKGVFVLPHKWMKEVFSYLQGRIHCPKCGNKLGNYDWIKGCGCACGMKASPAFYLVSSKIDLTNL